MGRDDLHTGPNRAPRVRRLLLPAAGLAAALGAILSLVIGGSGVAPRALPSAVEVGAGSALPPAATAAPPATSTPATSAPTTSTPATSAPTTPVPTTAPATPAPATAPSTTRPQTAKPGGTAARPTADGRSPTAPTTPGVTVVTPEQRVVVEGDAVGSDG